MRPIARLRLNAPLVIGGLILLGLLVVLILPTIVTLPSPSATRFVAEVDGKIVGPPFRPGELGYRFGSDAAGRDVFARVIHGARTSLVLALGITVVRTILCIPLGLLAGWRRGWTGRIVQGLATGFGSLPTLMLVIYCLQV